MNGLGIPRQTLIWLAALGLFLPQLTLAQLTLAQLTLAHSAAMASDPSPTTIDVMLRDGGLLLGQVVDAQGQPQPFVPVSLYAKDRLLATAQTDAQGRYTLTGLRGGIYRLVSAGGHGTYRLWNPGAGPPTCRGAALLIVGNALRGNLGLPGAGALHFWLSDPYVVAGLIGAGVAVPIIIHNNQRPSSP